MEMMTYEETLEKIHEFNVFGSKLGLERMKKLLSLLGDPHKDMRIIHIAGTNGKGSVSRYLYTVLNECGYRAGAYFSPFLERFTERIECGGCEIGAEELPVYTEMALKAVDQMKSEGFESPTEFELVTAIGLLYFRERKADPVILEVGLGGRGDSTNICDRPEATVITSISYDHMDRLGDTLEKIAWDKAGIIKAGVPVTTFAEDEGACGVIADQARQLDAPVIDLRQAVIDVKSCDKDGSRFSVRLGMQDGADGSAETTDVTKKTVSGIYFEDIEISMTGRHQINNAVCALSVIAQLRARGYDINEEKLRAGMKKASQPGRFERISTSPDVYIDGAHNIAGVQALTETILRDWSGKRILLCTGILADKEFDLMARELARLDADLITTDVPIPRKLDADKLADVFRKIPPYSSKSRSIRVVEDWKEAADLAESIKDDYDLVIWSGSLYLIGAVRGYLKSR